MILVSSAEFVCSVEQYETCTLLSIAVAQTCESRGTGKKEQLTAVLAASHAF